MLKSYSGVSALAIAAMLIVPAEVSAQQVTGSQTSASALHGVGDIVVTSRRREERLQDTPLAVTAMTADTLENMNVRATDNLDARVPNLSLSVTPASASSSIVAYIRGIGEYAPNWTNDASVGVYIDGVYMARPYGGLMDLVDIERIEVLRGPQGTLFGRNTTGGALNIITKGPQDELGGDARISYGSNSELVASGALNTGDMGGSGIKARFSLYHHQRNGYVDNILTSKKHDPGSQRTTSASADLSAELFSGFTLDYRGDFSITRSVSPASQIRIAAPHVIDYFSKSPSYGGAPFVVSDEYLSKIEQYGTLPQSQIRSYGNSLTAEYAPSDSISLKSITAWRTLTVDENTQLDGNGLLLGQVLGFADPVRVSPYSAVPSAVRRQNQFSQELQLLGSTGDVEWVAGLYYFNEHVRETAPFFMTFVLDADTAFNIQPTTNYSANAKSYAAFGQASWRPASLDEKLELTIGGRYTRDKRSMEQQNSSDGMLLPARSLERSFNNFSVTGSISYKWAPDVMTFARISTGYKAGGFNPQSVNDGYDPMKAIAGEVGIKADLADRRLRINATAFYTDYRDLQVAQFVAGSAGTTNETVNAGRAHYKGFELEIIAHPFPGFQLDGSLGYVDPKYKKFFYRDPLTDEIVDVAGEARFAYVSKTTAHIGGQYRAELGGGAHLTFRADYSYKSGRYWNPLDRDSPFNHAIAAGADNDVTARIVLGGIQMGGADVEISAWVDNLLNKHVITGGIDYGVLGFGGVNYNRPRNGGAQLRVRF